MHVGLSNKQRQVQADCLRTLSLLYWQTFRRQRPDNGRYDSFAPTSAVHTVSPPRRAHKQGRNKWRKPVLWTGGGCLSAPEEHGRMSHNPGITRRRRVANRSFTFPTDISLATTRAAQKSEMRLFGAEN